MRNQEWGKQEGGLGTVHWTRGTAFASPPSRPSSPAPIQLTWIAPGSLSNCCQVTLGGEEVALGLGELREGDEGDGGGDLEEAAPAAAPPPAPRHGLDKCGAIDGPAVGQI